MFALDIGGAIHIALTVYTDSGDSGLRSLLPQRWK